MSSASSDRIKQVWQGDLYECPDSSSSRSSILAYRSVNYDFLTTIRSIHTAWFNTFFLVYLLTVCLNYYLMQS